MERSMKILSVLTSVLFICSAQAAYNGSVSFSSQEVANHAANTPRLLSVAKVCLEEYQTKHINFYRSNCIRLSNGKTKCLSKYFGDRRFTKKRVEYRADGQRLSSLAGELRKHGFNASLINQMESTSCVGMAIQCLRRGFAATNQMTQWNKIAKFYRRNGVGGTSIQFALAKLGWRTFYWNPETTRTIDSETKKWDVQEANWQSKGWHNYRYKSVMNKNRYWFNYIDDKYTMVGFEDGTPQILYSVPFWVGTAHTGYHVFPGTYERVIEAHSTKGITDVNNMEFSQFAPMKQGGGPRWTATQKYRSGMIVLPPGY
jgi:hypothetical protein